MEDPKENIQVVLTIPKEFVGHFEQDRFYDSLMRLNSDAHLLAGNYEQETAKMLIGAFKDCKVLPKGCSPNGDLITKQQAIDIVEFYQMNPQHFNFVSVIDEIKDEKPVIAALQSDPGMSTGRMM